MDELQKKIEFHTERFIEGLRNGETLQSMIGDVVIDSSHWGAENVKKHMGEKK